MLHYRLHIIFIILQFIRPLEAQNYLQPEILPVENGLSSQTVTCLTFDRKGYLWVGTQSGLERYDGYRFIQFFQPKNGQFTASDQQIKAVQTDRQGNLWILSDAGLSQYVYRSGEIKSYTLSTGDSASFTEKAAKDMYAGNNGEAWLLTNLTLIDLEPGKAARYYTIPRNVNREDSITSCLQADGNGNIWVGTSGGIRYFDRQQQAFREFMPQNSQGLLSDRHVNCLFLDADNLLWIGTQNGLNRFDPVDYDFESYFPGSGENVQPANEIYSIDKSPEGGLIVATAAGMFSFNKTGEVFTKINESNEYKITSVVVDSFGTIWGGTSRGIIKIRESRLSIRNFTSRGNGMVLMDNQVSKVAAGTGGSVFIGYPNNQYEIADFVNQTRKSYSTLDGSRVISFCPFRDKEHIVLTEHELEIVNATQTERTSFRGKYPFVKKELIENNSLTCILYDGSNNLWLGTSAGLELIRFDSASHIMIRTLRKGSESLEIGHVYDMAADAGQNLWLGTANGLLMYNPKLRTFYKYTPYDKTLLNTEHKEVYTLMAESGKILWIGTSRGAYRFDIPTREFTAVISDPVFLGTPVRAIAMDKTNKVWIGSTMGLYLIIDKTGSPQFFDQREGLINTGYTTVCSGNDGMVYLGGREGLSVIDPHHIGLVSASARVEITRLHFIESEPQNEKVIVHISDTTVLPWARKPIRIDFASMNLSRPEFSKYRYRIGKTGRDAPWHPLGSQNFVILDHLSPGKYTFSVSGDNAAVYGNQKVTSLVIVIEVPKWRSNIALAVYALAGIMLIVFALRGIIRRFFNLSRENQEREMFARQIVLQKEELSLKNKSITDSINYARRIQTAMLPPYRLFKSIFPSSFVLYMPKDIVSGDFYWINKLNDKIFVAAVDCTGHGVPGAFMSIIGFELFRKITNIEGLSRPSDILNRLNEDFHVIFKDVDNVVLRDGMDVAFCSIDKKNMILEYAGAFNPLYLIRDNKINEIKGDRFAIGLDETNFKDQTFKNHLIPIQSDDIVYIFSDGFADQFGGPDGKKYKYRRFRHLLLNLHQLPMQKQHEILENNVMEWRGEQEQVDDILVIGIKIDF
jgi:ligand-binding sensor domain-containing protein/serine phosphatase RsbU (regulator of sigma subunit)